MLLLRVHSADGRLSAGQMAEEWYGTDWRAVRSWLMRYPTDKHLPGLYAVRVTGTLPDAIVEDLEARGIRVQSREMNDD
jgi:hypothetical protein